MNSSNSARISLTQLAHDRVRSVVKQGDIVVDATAGNGYDTLFMAQLVGEQGTVYSFDIQSAAIENTRQRIEQVYLNNSAGDCSRCPRLIQICDDHASMTDHIDQQHRSRIACVMFNLGYLPAGDRSIVTSSASTLSAIACAIDLLSDRGCLSILAYTGHPGGKEEAVAVETMLRESFGVDGRAWTRTPETDVPNSPIHFFLKRSGL